MITFDAVVLAALAASLIVLAIKWELWHRNEQKNINAYRDRLRIRLLRVDEDVAWNIWIARGKPIVESSSAAALAHRLTDVA